MLESVAQHQTMYLPTLPIKTEFRTPKKTNRHSKCKADPAASTTTLKGTHKEPPRKKFRGISCCANQHLPTHPYNLKIIYTCEPL